MPAATDWFRTYFSEPYGEVYADYLLPPAMSVREAAFVRRALGLRAHDRVLDCPCGYGRHMGRLLPAPRATKSAPARSGCIVGLDLNADCLARAAEGPLPDAAVLIRGDMRHLPFPAARFDAVVNLFNSFGYFGPDENRHVLREFARVLVPGGRLLLDLANPAPLIDLIREVPRTEVRLHDLVQVEHWRYDGRTRRLYNRTEVSLAGRRVERAYDFRLHTLDEIAAMLERAGFDGDALYGGFAGEPYEENASERLIVVAERRP